MLLSLFISSWYRLEIITNRNTLFVLRFPSLLFYYFYFSRRFSTLGGLHSSSVLHYSLTFIDIYQRVYVLTYTKRIKSIQPFQLSSMLHVCKKDFWVADFWLGWFSGSGDGCWVFLWSQDLMLKVYKIQYSLARQQTFQILGNFMIAVNPRLSVFSQFRLGCNDDYNHGRRSRRHCHRHCY